MGWWDRGDPGAPASPLVMTCFFFRLHWVFASVRRTLSICGRWAQFPHSIWDCSSLTGDWTYVPYIAKWALNHWTNRGSPPVVTLRIVCLLSNHQPSLEWYISTLSMVPSHSEPSENGRLPSMTSHSSGKNRKNGETPDVCRHWERGNWTKEVLFGTPVSCWPVRIDEAGMWRQRTLISEPGHLLFIQLHI